MSAQEMLDEFFNDLELAGTLQGAACEALGKDRFNALEDEAYSLDNIGRFTDV